MEVSMLKKRAKPKKYDREFKINAVKLVLESNRNQREVCENLGITKSALSRWVQSYTQDAEEGFPGKGRLKPSEEELRRLKREMEVLRQERDILKKALSIFSSSPSENMLS